MVPLEAASSSQPQPPHEPATTPKSSPILPPPGEPEPEKKKEEPEPEKKKEEPSIPTYVMH